MPVAQNIQIGHLMGFSDVRQDGRFCDEKFGPTRNRDGDATATGSARRTRSAPNSASAMITNAFTP